MRLAYIGLFSLFIVLNNAVGAEHSRINITVLDGAHNEVGRVIFPVDRSYRIEFVADEIERDKENEIVVKGNARVILIQGAEHLTFVGKEIRLQREILGREKFTAINDLDKMAVSDQLYRKRSGFEKNLRFLELQKRIDLANQQRLKRIVELFGWPGSGFAGARGAQAAFLVLQHGPINYSKEILPLVRHAKSRNDVPSAELALLEDRVLVSEGKPQLYGTQIDKAGNLYPVEDDIHVDDRRKQLGLSPLREYLKNIGVDCKGFYC